MALIRRVANHRNRTYLTGPINLWTGPPGRRRLRDCKTAAAAVNRMASRAILGRRAPIRTKADRIARQSNARTPRAWTTAPTRAAALCSRVGHAVRSRTARDLRHKPHPHSLPGQAPPASPLHAASSGACLKNETGSGFRGRSWRCRPNWRPRADRLVARSFVWRKVDCALRLLPGPSVDSTPCAA